MTTPATILVVDDNPSQRYAICKALQKAGFSTTETSHGAEALLKARENPDLVLLDVRLPDMDGFEICRRLKSDRSTSSIPVVMISATEQNGSAVSDALQIGALSYLFVPYSPMELVSVVSGALARAAANSNPPKSSSSHPS